MHVVGLFSELVFFQNAVVLLYFSGFPPNTKEFLLFKLLFCIFYHPDAMEFKDPLGEGPLKSKNHRGDRLGGVPKFQGVRKPKKTHIILEKFANRIGVLDFRT